MTICPDSEEVLPADADRGAWLEARREGIGGSDASAIAGVNEFTSLYEVWLDKTGRGTPKRYTPEMRFGHLIEDDARQVFTEDTGIGVALAGGAAVYGALKLAVGLRLDQEEEFNGADLSIHRITATAERESNW